MLNPVSVPTFCVPRDGVETTVGSGGYATGSGSLTVAPGTGSLFGSPSSAAPLRVSAIRTTSDGRHVHFLVTAVVSDTLTVASTLDGYSDIPLAPGDKVGIFASSGAVQDLNTAVVAAIDALNSTITVVNAGGGGGGGSGTVTSVGLSMPAIFAVANSPITGSGTIAVTLATQAQALVFAGPASGFNAAPAFRALQATDLPTIPGSQISGNIAGNAGSITGSISESQVTGLAAALAALATIASPSFTGTVTLPTGLSGVLKATAGVLSTAAAGTDYAAPGTVTAFTRQQVITPVALTPGVTVAWNMDLAPNATLTPNSNFTVSNPTNLRAGGSGVLTITQDGTGGRVVTWGSAYKGVGGVKPVLSTAANSKDQIGWYSEDGTSVTLNALTGVA
jgi:hypothetical protein